MPYWLRTLTPATNITSSGFRTAKQAQTLVRAAANQSFQTQTNRFRICLHASGQFGFFKEALVNMQRFFHTYKYAVSVWMYRLYSP